MRHAIVASLKIAVLACVVAWVPPSRAQSRGELLYSTHCIACHNAQMHWRDKKLATDGPSLKMQVRRWQATALLGWSDADIDEVVRHLNERHYHFAPAPRLGHAAAAATAADKL